MQTLFVLAWITRSVVLYFRFSLSHSLVRLFLTMIFVQLDMKTNLISLNKCSLWPYSVDCLSSCFRSCESGRYIVKVPKSNDGVILLWILPNQLISSTTTFAMSMTHIDLQYYRRRRVLIALSNEQLMTEWKRDFAVNTLLVTRSCLEQLSRTIEQTTNIFPHQNDARDRFQSLTIDCYHK
jgi:hypothetical protein